MVPMRVVALLHVILFTPELHGRGAPALPASSTPSLRRSLHDLDLLLGQAIQLLDQPVDLAVGGDDLALEGDANIQCQKYLTRLKESGILYLPEEENRLHAV